jgi:arylsulfatase A-like enzyme
MYLHNHRSGTNGTPLDTRFTNWAIEARRAGYDPALFGYTHTAPDPRGLADDDPRLTTDEGLLPGIRPVVDMATHCGPWRDWLRGLGYALPSDHGMTYGARATEHSDPQVPRPALYDAQHTDTWFLTQRAMDWIGAEEQRDNPGWFVHLSLRAPHPPWVAAAPYNARYPVQLLPDAQRCATPEAEAALHPWLAHHLFSGRNQSHPELLRHRLLQASYYGLMAEVDDNLGRLFAHLRALGADTDTLIVFTSDHGEQMGDHWLYGKAGFFDQSYHIPLIVRAPDGVPGGRVQHFTEHVDLLPTMLRWLGLQAPRQCDGASLLPFVNGATPAQWREAAHWEFDFRGAAAESALGLPMEACTLNVIRDARTKYVHFAALPPLLFDLGRDPHELTNVAAEPAYTAVRSAQVHALLSWRMQHADKTLSHIQVTREAGLQVRGP